MITDRTGVLTTQAGTQQIREKRVRYVVPASDWSNDCKLTLSLARVGTDDLDKLVELGY